MERISEALTIAVGHHQAGRLADAEQIYRQVTATDPSQADAWHLLGVIAYQVGRYEVAVEHIQRAIRLDGNRAAYHNNLGNVLIDRSIDPARLEKAILCYRQALNLEPNYAEAHNNLGNALRGQGKLEEAMASYRRALRLKPDYADAHNNLGAVLKSRGDLEEAIVCYRRALALQPSYTEAWNNLGSALQRKGSMEEAIVCFQRVVALRPGDASACNNLGNALKGQGKLEEAIALYRRAVRLKPDCAEAHSNLGIVLTDQGSLDEAIACCRRAVELQPRYAEAWYNLGNALREQATLDEAITCYQRALELKPDYAEARNNLGNALKDQGRLDEAMACYRAALALRPGAVEIHNNLAVVFLEKGLPEEAIACCHRALIVKPDDAEAHNNLGFAWHAQGEPDKAITFYERALALAPNYVDAHQNLSLAWLAVGDWQRGWSEYEWRWRAKDRSLDRFRQPAWDGRPLEGKTVLLHAEQGLGDTLMFIRYADVVTQSGAKVVVECQKPLVRLLARSAGIDQLVAHGDTLPEFDVHAPLASLPRISQTSLDNVPARVPYVFAEPVLIEAWRERLSKLDGFKVGIAWQGNRTFGADRARSIPLRHFAALAEIPDVRLISLQKGFGSEQLAEVRDLFPVLDLAEELDQRSGPFMDTAAVMNNLDLVITSDTAIPHLAGALGVPTWVALSFAPDWRWLLNRDDSPWYPSMRLFRQDKRDDWQGVFGRMKAALSEELSSLVQIAE